MPNSREPQNEDRFVSQVSFHDVLALLAENRDVMRGQIKGLSDQLAEVGRQITTRQDIQNGRMLDAEGTIVDLRVEVSSVKTQIEGVKGEVEEILNEGCRQKTNHIKELTAIVQRTTAGFPVDDTEVYTTRLPTAWPKREVLKKVGIGSGLVGLGALTPHILNGVHWVIEHFTFVQPTITK